MTDNAIVDEWMSTQRARDVFHGYTADEIKNMPVAQFARLRELAGFPPIGSQPGAQAPPEPEPSRSGADSAGTHGDYAEDMPDFGAMSMQEYAQFRQEAGIGGREYGNGIFGVHGSWADAAKAKAGRSAMAGNRNTIEPPRIEGRYLQHDDQLDHRSAAQRLSNQANIWQGR